MRHDPARLALGRKRLLSALASHTIATARTLEQKIADAGPTNQRIDPHILTTVRQTLVAEDLVSIRRAPGSSVPWYYLTSTSATEVEERFGELLPIYERTQQHAFHQRLGQTLEIAFYRACLATNPMPYLGAYLDLEAHDDSTLYSKEEPPSSYRGKTIPDGKKLDFLLIHPEAGAAGIEIKNVREWLYPDRSEVKDLLLKCCVLDVVPVLIGRRIPFVTFRLLNACGVVIHQTYNQRYPSADSGLAALVRDKRLLAYHDLQLGNEPDARLLKFIGVNLRKILPKARATFDAYSDLVRAYAFGHMNYPEFAARVRRRQSGQNEDADLDIEP